MKRTLILTQLVLLFFLIQSQLKVTGQNIENKKIANIDTLSHIRIDKIIYYQHPLLLKNDFLVDKEYIPEWYKAYCANANHEYFTNYPKEAVGLFHSISGVTEQMLSEHLNNIKTKTAEENNPLPFTFVFGEIWLTYSETGDQIVITRSYDSEKDIPNLMFKLPIQEMNIKEERTDSIGKLSGFTNFYIREDGILKIANQENVYIDKLCQNGSIKLALSLEKLKDLLYRSPSYVRSIIKNNHRIFETVKNTPNGPVVVGEDGGKSWFQKYWWAIIGGLAALALLAYMVLSRRKK